MQIGVPKEIKDNEYRVSMVPAGASTTCAILATLRSCLWLHPSKIGTSLSRSILSPCLTVVPEETGSGRALGS